MAASHLAPGGAKGRTESELSLKRATFRRHRRRAPARFVDERQTTTVNVAVLGDDRHLAAGWRQSCRRTKPRPYVHSGGTPSKIARVIQLCWLRRFLARYREKLPESTEKVGAGIELQIQGRIYRNPKRWDHSDRSYGSNSTPDSLAGRYEGSNSPKSSTYLRTDSSRPQGLACTSGYSWPSRKLFGTENGLTVTFGKRERPKPTNGTEAFGTCLLSKTGYSSRSSRRGCPQ